MLIKFYIDDNDFDYKKILSEVRRIVVLRALSRSKFNKSHAARLLKIRRTTLLATCKKYLPKYVNDFKGKKSPNNKASCISLNASHE